MDIVFQEVEVLGATPLDPHDMLRRIELAGRVCYKSEAAITSDSAIRFCLSKGVNETDATKRHFSVLEHSNLVVGAHPHEVGACSWSLVELLTRKGHLFEVHTIAGQTPWLCVSGNLRAWMELLVAAKNAALMPEELNLFAAFAANETLRPFFTDAPAAASRWQYVSGHDHLLAPHIPDKLKRYTVRAVTNRGISHEIVRHRLMSYSQESTRYVNYASRPMVMIAPYEYDQWDAAAKDEWYKATSTAALCYSNLVGMGVKPQHARGVLPQDLKTEMYITGTLEQWRWFITMRGHKSAHPQIQELAEKVRAGLHI